MFNVGEVVNKTPNWATVRGIVNDVVGKEVCPGIINHIKFSKDSDKIYYISNASICCSELKDGISRYLKILR